MNKLLLTLAAAGMLTTAATAQGFSLVDDCPAYGSQPSSNYCQGSSAQQGFAI